MMVATYKNKHMVDILKYYLREQLLRINAELHKVYVLKEMFLDLVDYSDYEHAEEEIRDWIDVCKGSGLKEFDIHQKQLEINYSI